MNDTQNSLFFKISMFIDNTKKLKTRVLLLVMMENWEQNCIPAINNLKNGLNVSNNYFQTLANRQRRSVMSEKRETNEVSFTIGRSFLDGTFKITVQKGDAMKSNTLVTELH